MSDLPTGYIIDPAVIRDREFLEDYGQVASLHGLARKKAIAELVEYNCIDCLEGVYVVLPIDTETAECNGSATTFLHGFLVFDIAMMERVIHRKLPAEMFPKVGTTEGWVAEADVLKLSEDEMKILIDELQANRDQ